MSFSDVVESELLGLYLNGTAIANIADNAASSPATSLYLAAHTADPGEAGSAQTTSEASYPGYARIAVVRSTGTPQWTLSGTSPTSATTTQRSWPASTGAGTTLTHWSLGTAASGAGKIIVRAALTPNIAIGAAGITPQVTPTITLD